MASKNNLVIPKQLQKKNYRFIKTHKYDKEIANQCLKKLKSPNLTEKQKQKILVVFNKPKVPSESKWTTENHYRWDEPSFQEYLETATGYGVMAGRGDLTIVDSDQPIIKKIIKEHLPETFTIRTGGGKGHYHFYFECKLRDKIILKNDDKDNHYGEVQWTGAQVIGPGSIHPSGNKYTIVRDKPIAKVTIKQLITALKPYLTTKDLKKYFKHKNEKVIEDETPYETINIKPLLKHIKGLNRQGDEYVGSHPIHGSTTGRNFSINIEKNTWFCFRCNSGGGPLALVAVLEKIISCENVKDLTGKKFLKTKKLAIKKYGLTIEGEEEPTKEPMKPKGKRKKATLKDIYRITEKWLGIKLRDRNRIDAILAVSISNKIPGTPLWLFIVGPSGDWKTTFCKALSGIHRVIKIDQLTKNTLASGLPKIKDLGKTLAYSSHILLILDLASLISKNVDDKNAIWGQFRPLYDGDIYKQAGSGVKKEYEGCHVTIIACTTPAIRNEVLIHSQLGTRELMYNTDADPIDNNFKMDRAVENEKYEEEMQRQMENVVTSFWHCHDIKDIEISDEIMVFLKEECIRLTTLRASGMVDRSYRELINPIDPEVPTRLIKQFVRLYRCLKSLDDDYPDKKAKEIISHIVNSSCDKIRRMTLELFENEPDEEFKIIDVQNYTRVGRKAVKSQLEMLWNLKVLDKRTEFERVGSITRMGQYGEEEIGGKIEEISYYCLSGYPTFPPTKNHENDEKNKKNENNEKNENDKKNNEKNNEENDDGFFEKSAKNKKSAKKQEEKTPLPKGKGVKDYRANAKGVTTHSPTEYSEKNTKNVCVRNKKRNKERNKKHIYIHTGGNLCQPLLACHGKHGHAKQSQKGVVIDKNGDFKIVLREDKKKKLEPKGSKSQKFRHPKFQKSKKMVKKVSDSPKKRAIRRSVSVQRIGEYVHSVSDDGVVSEKAFFAFIKFQLRKKYPEKYLNVIKKKEIMIPHGEGKLKFNRKWKK